MRGLESWVLTYALNSLWQLPLLLAAGWVAARLVRCLGPAAEHRVWVGTLVLQCSLPAISSLPSAWLRSLLVWNLWDAAHGTGYVSVTMRSGEVVTGWHPGAGLFGFAALAYFALTTYFAARFLWRCLQLAAMRREAADLTLAGETAMIWSQCVRRLGKQVRLATSTAISAPVTIGVRQLLILLPAEMEHQISDAEFRTLTEHEFAHVERHDFLKNLVYEFLALPVSYHPFCHFTRARITETREMVCDEIAAEASGAIEYGRSLLRLAAQLIAAPIPTPHAIGIFDGKTLERRIMRLKDKQVEVKGERRLAMLLGCALLAGATCASAVALHMNVDAATQDAKAHPKFVHVSAGVMAGNVLSKIVPKYPPEAKKKGIQGKVTLDATISKQGDVADLKVASGPEVLRQSALDAVKQWKYKPFLLNGQPVEVKTTINVIYSLAK